MDLTIAIRIASLVALIAFIVLAVYLVFTLKSVTRIIQDVKNIIDRLSTDLSSTMLKLTGDIDQLKTEAIQTLDSIEKATDEVTQTIKKVEGEFESLTATIKPFQDLALRVYGKISAPVDQASSVVAAATKAVSAFTSVLFHRGNHH
jgi:uncharacterized protein YoxC